MRIRDMFAEDINRRINGVIKVDQSSGDITCQEVKEYVITRELKKHFIRFFDYYSEAFDAPTADVGVWISGFFGSPISSSVPVSIICLLFALVPWNSKCSNSSTAFALLPRI